MCGARACAVILLSGCGGSTVEPEMTDGTFFITFSEAVDTNMNVEPFEATQAHGTFGLGGYCSGGLHQDCYEWDAFQLNGADDATRRIRLSVNISDVASDVTKAFTTPNPYAALYVEDNYDPKTPWTFRGWAAHGGLLRIVSVDGDLVAFTLEGILMKPQHTPADDETLGTFRIDASGEILIERKE